MNGGERSELFGRRELWRSGAGIGREWWGTLIWRDRIVSHRFRQSGIDAQIGLE